MKVVLKVGGAVLDQPEARAAFARSVQAAREDGHAIVVVHGGGAQLTRLADALGIVTERVEGLRVTSPAMERAALQALGGEVNADLVAALVRTGVRAIGLTGADGGLVEARPKDPRLGLVGEVESVDGSVLDDLVASGFVPVVATMAPHPDGDGARFLNVNADAVVGPIAAAFGADAVLFLSDVPHLRGEGDVAVDALDAAEAERLTAIGVIAGGMLPKVAAGFAACAALPPSARVRMGSGLLIDCVRTLLAGGGTTFQRSTSEVNA